VYRWKSERLKVLEGEEEGEKQVWEAITTVSESDVSYNIDGTPQLH
jgi:hypothetical protein